MAIPCGPGLLLHSAPTLRELNETARERGLAYLGKPSVNVYMTCGGQREFWCVMARPPEPVADPVTMHASTTCLTVAELKRLIADWSEVGDNGEACEVWIGTRDGTSNGAYTVMPLNKRTSEDGSRVFADLLLEPTVDDADGRGIRTMDLLAGLSKLGEILVRPDMTIGKLCKFIALIAESDAEYDAGHAHDSQGA